MLGSCKRILLKYRIFQNLLKKGFFTQKGISFAKQLSDKWLIFTNLHKTFFSLQNGLENKGYEEWVAEMVGMRDILKHLSNISKSEVVGMRAPFLKPGRNTQYKVIIYDNNVLRYLNLSNFRY